MATLFSDLFLKCHDASVFSEKNHFDVLSKVYFDDNHSKQVLKQDQYFIIGEKGTGKTMIAQYLSNIRQDLNCSIVDFSTIDFNTFRKLNDEGYLKFIQADQLWQVLLMVLAAEIVVNKENSILGSLKFRNLHAAIAEFYQNRFTPEFPVAVQLMSKFGAFAEISEKHLGKLGGSAEAAESLEFQKGHSPLNTVRSHLIEAFSEAKINSDHVIFIDKIDIKPDDIEFEKFIQALRSFARAALYLNESVFAKMKGKKRIKFVLLARPDIFDKLNLQNQSARASDNSVILNWDTTYAHHRVSNLFQLTDHFLGRQSEQEFRPGGAWDHYVDKDVLHESLADPDMQTNLSFREFLRVSWFRPRDIIRCLHICQKQPGCKEKVNRTVFERSAKQFSDYLYGEVKDFSRFYFSDETFNLIERFFSEVQQLGQLTYADFLRVHEIFIRKVKGGPDATALDARVEDADLFLQILYSSNIICWRAKNDFGTVDDYWAFRERSATQLDPKVGLYQEYAVHYGLRRALRLNARLVAGVRD